MHFKPINLRIDYGATRITDSSHPIFGWGAAHEGSGRRQAACRVTVYKRDAAASIDGAVYKRDTAVNIDCAPVHTVGAASCIGGAAVWDSGWIESPARELKYQGPALVSGTVYTWTIRLRVDTGAESGEAASEFMTALYEEWDAPWIAARDDEESCVRYFRREFAARDGLARAALFVGAAGLARASVNGRPCCDHVLEPAVSDYSKRCYYSTYDITDKIIGGMNCVGVALADGWRRNNGPYLKALGDFRPPLFGTPALTAILRLEYADGSVDWVRAGDEWQAGKGPVLSSHLFDGEHYDARRRVPGWDEPGFDNAKGGFQRPAPCEFQPAAICRGPEGRLTAQTLEPIRITRVYEAVSVDMIEPGRWIFDFGQNIAGAAILSVPSGVRPGVKITIRHAEILDEDGGLYTAPLRGAKAEDSYITGRSEPDIWMPAFTYHGFRYAELIGYPGVPDKAALRAAAFNTDIKNGGFFECGNALVNAIHKMVVHTELANMHGILTDCPQRDERMGWMNDATVRFVETPNNFDIGRMFPKIVADICDEQGADGAITCTAPFVYGRRPADPVCSSFLIAADMARIYTGNMEVVESAYPALCAWNDFLAASSDGGIVNYSHYGDWAGPADYCLGENGAQSTVTPGIYMSTGYHYHNSVLLAKFAKLLGHAADVAAHMERAEAIKKAFLAKWFNADSCVAGTGSQGCQAFALWLGILPEGSRTRAAQYLNAKVLSDGLRLTTGNLTTYYLMDMLAEYGYADTAWALLTRTDYPSWGFMHGHGATTVWERFELKKNPGMNSHSHPMYGAVGAFLYRRLCGVISDATGFARFRVKPCFPSGLNYVQGVIETRLGDVRVMWHKKYGATYVTVAVPFGAEAEIILPGIREAKASGVWRYTIPD